MFKEADQNKIWSASFVPLHTLTRSMDLKHIVRSSHSFYFLNQRKTTKDLAKGALPGVCRRRT